MYRPKSYFNYITTLQIKNNRPGVYIKTMNAHSKLTCVLIIIINVFDLPTLSRIFVVTIKSNKVLINFPIKSIVNFAQDISNDV